MAVASGAYKKALEGDQTPKQVLVKIDRVTKKFDETIAVDDVSLEINKGEIFALLGGSGSGKSTLLRMLAGFERPTEGRIFLDGVDITDMPPYERPINMMFQSYALFPHMTVAQNIAFGLKQDKMSNAEIDARVGEMLKLVHMSQYAKRKPHQLSGGQRQRVALARSLAKRPKLLLLDEPMGALDKKLRSQMQLELVEIIDRYLGFDHKIKLDVELPTVQFKGKHECGRCELGEREAGERIHDWNLVEQGLTEEEARQEASRCLRCDHFGFGAFRGGRNLEW